MEEIVAPAEELEEAAITTVTDTSFLDANRKKMKVAQLATQMNNMIKGKVTDDKGEPLIGANVTYKGTTYGKMCIRDRRSFTVSNSLEPVGCTGSFCFF